jgi:hypothetical protein
MGGNEYSRREFLKTFAMLSSASLVGLNSGCAGPVAMDAYGPPPANMRPEVTEVYFIDSQSTKIFLPNNQNVPVQVQCRIDFDKSMNTAAPVMISFADSAGNAVPKSQAWANDQTMVVTPVSQLLLNTAYTLSVGNDAEDTFGNKIVLTEVATATFRTFSA